MACCFRRSKSALPGPIRTRRLRMRERISTASARDMRRRGQRRRINRDPCFSRLENDRSDAANRARADAALFLSGARELPAMRCRARGHARHPRARRRRILDHAMHPVRRDSSRYRQCLAAAPLDAGFRRPARLTGARRVAQWLRAGSAGGSASLRNPADVSATRSMRARSSLRYGLASSSTPESSLP